jgi:hypothetical protein
MQTPISSGPIFILSASLAQEGAVRKTVPSAKRAASRNKTRKKAAIT